MNRRLAIMTIPLIIMLVLGTPSQSMLDRRNSKELSLNEAFLTFSATSPPELVGRTRTYEFINSTRYIEQNNATSMDQIYYRIGSLKIIDPALGNLTNTLKQRWISQLLTFQNSDGGFGGWQYDSSSLSHTRKAVQILNWLGELGQINSTQVKVYLDSLQNSLTLGFNSYKYDPDSDVYTTYLAVDAYTILGEAIPNDNLVDDVFIRAQNNNTSFVPNIEIGGFGKQTNNLKDIYWTSEVTVTRAALSALNMQAQLNSVNQTEALAFVQNMQTVSGGFVNDPVLNQVTVPYSASALEAINLVGGTALDAVKARDYFLSLEDSTGGYRLSSTSTGPTFLGTFYALRGLDVLGEQPTNVTQTIEYLLDGVAYSDGYGGTPGETPSLRETFDALYALNLTGRYPANPSGLTDYVQSYYNPDGGYGLTGSYVESTYRAVFIYHLLGIPIPNASQTIAFLQGLQQSNGGFSKGATLTTTYVISTYRTIMSLDLLGSQPANTVDAISYLLANQNMDGGFGGFVGDISDVSSTYRAVRALLTLGDNSFDGPAAVAFVKSSQNLDGGYRRSPYDTTLPNNVSSAVYSYSAVRTMLLLNENPSNSTALYEFLVDIRNFDGGYGLRDRYTSDIAYTFTSLWLLQHYDQISDFNLQVPENLNSVRTNYDQFNISLLGGIPSYVVNIEVENTTLITPLLTQQVDNIGIINVDTSSLADDNYTLSVSVIDLTGAEIIVSTELLINRAITTTTTTTQTSTTGSFTSSSSTTTNMENTTSSSTDSGSSSPTSPQNLDLNSILSQYLTLLIGVIGIGAVVALLALTRRKK